MNIGEFLRGERHANELTQMSLASLTGVGQSRISEIEHGIRSPTWDTVERLLEGMGCRPVLDTRPLDEVFDDPAAIRIDAMTLEERFKYGVPLAGLLLQRLQRRGARLAFDGPTAATLLGVRVPSPWTHFVCPESDLEQLVYAMNDGAAQGWSERFRDYRVGIGDSDQLLRGEPTKWLMRGMHLAVRVSVEWRPLVVTIAGSEVALTPLEDLRQDPDVAVYLKGLR